MAKHPFTVSPQFYSLRWRLLLSSLGVIGCTLTTFGIVVYQVVAHHLEQKSDRQLAALADAAAHSLPDILTNQPAILDRAPRAIDNDGDLDIPWQDLRQDEQSIEWFDTNGKLLGQAGRSFPETPLFPQKRTKENESNEDENENENEELHLLTLPVYAAEPSDQSISKKLQGYVRVSELNEATEEELKRLRSGLQWGSLLALGLSGIGGWWLTRQSLQPIERSMLQLKQFTADASHELRNPLTAIKTSVEVMQSHPERLHASDLRKLNAIASATSQMSQLVDDLLWLARTDRETPFSGTYITLPIDELLEEVLDQYLSQAEQKTITLAANLQANTSIQGDALQLKRLFANLIANALQYTPTGGSVMLTSTLEDDWAIIRIADTGIGIAPEHLPFVFDRFWRADQARERREGGSGLGLAIVQAIVQQHQGKISVQSQLGQGSCFQVEFPPV